MTTTSPAAGDVVCDPACEHAVPFTQSVGSAPKRFIVHASPAIGGG